MLFIYTVFDVRHTGKTFQAISMIKGLNFLYKYNFIVMERIFSTLFKAV